MHELGGSESDTRRDAATVDWSEDEPRKLDAILDEIESETAQEEEAPEQKSCVKDGSEEGSTEQT
jgi:hypothetical protein